MLDLATAALIYCLLVALVFVALWAYYDRRDHAGFEPDRRRVAFHCIRCDRLYSARAGTQLAHCPRCGHENARLKF